MPYPWIPPRGKLEKKAVFSPCVGDETTTNYTEPILIKISSYYCGAAFCGPARVCGCFISTVCWSHRRLLQFFRRWTLRLAFYWLFIWNFKEKSINHFLWHTLFVRLYQSIWLFHPHSTVKIQPFSPVSPWRDPRLRHVVDYSFGSSRKKASAIFCDAAFSLMHLGRIVVLHITIWNFLKTIFLWFKNS